MGSCLGCMEVDASVKCGVWLKIEPSTAVHRTQH